MRRLTIIILSMILIAALFTPGWVGTGIAAGKIPTIKIIRVERNKTVTIETKNYPANQTFKVRMGKMSTRGINGILVDTIDSGDGGTFRATFDIPKKLRDQKRISIRLESSSGYYSYNWFYNNTTGDVDKPPSKPKDYTGIPTFKILAVERNKTVTIETHNFPQDQKFDVRMGKMFTRGINGIHIHTTDSGKGGTFTATYDIPKELRGLYRISIRMESNSGYYAYNWFYNNTTLDP